MTTFAERVTEAEIERTAKRALAIMLSGDRISSEAEADQVASELFDRVEVNMDTARKSDVHVKALTAEHHTLTNRRGLAMLDFAVSNFFRTRVSDDGFLSTHFEGVVDPNRYTVGDDGEPVPVGGTVISFSVITPPQSED